MKNTIHRRSFLRTTGTWAAGVGLAASGRRPLLADQLAQGAPHAEKLGWRLGCQAYSFKEFTFREAVEKVVSLGLHCIEMFPGQKLTTNRPEILSNDEMSPEVRSRVKRGLADAGVAVPCYGVCRLPNDEAACRKTFDFAQEMGIETLVSEPPEEALDLIDKLCNEYEINLAIHNHPEPSHYWNPDIVLDACKGRSKRIGACADTGHWMRSGINPLDAIKKLEGRIISFHLKDLNKYGKGDEHDVPWGTGVADVKAMLTEIHRQGIEAVFSIEYEHNWLESLPEIAQCVKYFDKVAAELAAK